MADHFDQALRRGSARFALEVGIDGPAAVRARGNGGTAAAPPPAGHRQPLAGPELDLQPQHQPESQHQPEPAGQPGRRAVPDLGHRHGDGVLTNRCGAVVRNGQRVAFNLGVTDADSTASPVGYRDVAILAPHDFEVPIAGTVPASSTTHYSVGRWYLVG